MLPISFAPLQGYTTAAYRRLHHAMWGGVSHYYTPFVRIEKGTFRNRDINDILPANNGEVPVVPQMLVRNTDELQQLAELFLSHGYHRADINMGCPFPPVALHRRGSGLLPYPDEVAALLQVAGRYKELSFSLKLRLGLNDGNEWRELIASINEAQLCHVTLHPRVGRMQYKGSPMIEDFAAFYEQCRHPLIYNGDIMTIDDIERIENHFPHLAGIMVGRGLLANPALALIYRDRKSFTHKEWVERMAAFHNALYRHLSDTSQGDSQLMARAHALWDYFLPSAPRRERKQVVKATTPSRYITAVENLFTAWREIQ